MLKKITVTLFMLLASAFALAQGAPEADTFLWKISKQGRPDSWLLGTVHVGKVGSSLPAQYQRTLNQVAQLVVESNADELEQPRHAADAAKMMQMMSDTRTLNQSLGRVRVSALKQILTQGNDSLPVEGNSKTKPWALWISVQSLYSPQGYSYQYGIDNLLIQQAGKQQKTIIALERIEPMYYISAIPEDKIKRSLDMLIFNYRKVLEEQKTLVDDYQKHRASAIWEEVSNPDEQLKYLPQQDRVFWQKLMYQQLLLERNQQWLPKLIEILPQQSTLVAVGAAHLFGEQGLILRLRQVGYQVTPVLPPSN
ncbi:MAG: TraB/GumN family protein [Neisseria sp.]|nr:TraB/GumN family protein [Neisseria sp.]